MKYSAHKLLINGLLPNLNPKNSEVAELKAARKVIREAIREAFIEVRKHITSDSEGRVFIDENKVPLKLAEAYRKLDSTQKGALRKIIPKFAPQGSFVYGTANSPCHNPPQQLDFDDGTYLPTDLFEEKPVISKDLFFLIIDDALASLCSQNEGWELDPTKPTCARVIIDRRKHVDIPLYAIPRERFETMRLEALKSVQFSEEVLTRKLLNSTDVFMAMRSEEHWIKSDPKLVNNWFLACIDDYGKILLRVCRYLKAWRDHNFIKGGPSSIALMACAVKTFEAAASNRKTFKDDSEALLACANNLALQLENGVKSPVDESEPTLFPRSDLSMDEFNKILILAKKFGVNMNQALLSAQTTTEALHKLQEIFGQRLPFLPTMVQVSGAAAVLTSRPKPQPQPEVKNMSGG
jgi:hypothetical protein